MTHSIAVASGKGGTGKTTLSVCLYYILSEQLNGNIQLIDCDVEEPNVLLFFPAPELVESKTINRGLPFINPDKCTYCRKCVEYCEFNAIVVIPPAEFAEINAALCHSCGACLVACRDNAISESEEAIGVVNRYRLTNGSGMLEGKLRIGSTMQTMLIRNLKRSVPLLNGLTIYDAPPGTSCPVVETLVDTDFVVLVCEPTPFGLHDLRLMVSIVKEMEKPYGVVINKSGIGNKEVYSYLEEQGSAILGEIAYSRDFAAGYADGSILTAIPDKVRDQLDHIAGTIIQKLKA